MKTSKTTPTAAAPSRSNQTNEHTARPSIAVRLIRHAESKNNQVYRDARRLFRIGSDDCDVAGWQQYVSTHRRADCELSDMGQAQAENLATAYLEPLVESCKDVHVIVSPMLRTLLTLKPTVERCNMAEILVHAEYFETEGCHTKGVAEEGMRPDEIRKVLDPKNAIPTTSLQFEHFENGRGWWIQEGTESRAQAQRRASKFYVWLCEHLDAQLEQGSQRDATLETERSVHVLIGHGDFMGLLLQRIVASFGYAEETVGVPHRAGFVHWNTGVTELEYFGAGRFLILCQNNSSHIPSKLRSGGSLDDGWSYLMPYGFHDLDVSSGSLWDAFPAHVREQKDALQSLYRHSESGSSLTVEDQHHFAIRRSNQVVGVATYCTSSSVLSDLAIRPSATTDVMDKLLEAVKDHAKGRSISVQTKDDRIRTMLETSGFVPSPDDPSTMKILPTSKI